MRSEANVIPKSSLIDKLELLSLSLLTSYVRFVKLYADYED